MSDPFILDTQGTQVLIKTTAEDGTTHDYPFVVRTFNKHRLDASAIHEKKLMTLQAKTQKSGVETPAERLEMVDLLAKMCDERLASTNGPVTIQSLWDDGLIGLEHVVQLFTKVQQEAVGNPPA